MKAKRDSGTAKNLARREAASVQVRHEEAGEGAT